MPRTIVFVALYWGPLLRETIILVMITVMTVVTRIINMVMSTKLWVWGF